MLPCRFDYDRSDISASYDQARALSPESIAAWMRTIVRLVGPRNVTTILDLGCGTGRFSRPLARWFGARVLAVDPAIKMLRGVRTASARSEGGTVYRAQGQAECLSLRHGCVDLAFLSMSYHHFPDRGAARAELARVIRDDGAVVVRTVTRERLEQTPFPWFECFPEARQLELERMPSEADLRHDFEQGGFALRAAEAVDHVFAANYWEYYEKIRLRGISTLRLISHEAFAQGLRRFRDYCETQGEEGPVTETIDLIVFVRKGASVRENVPQSA